MNEIIKIDIDEMSLLAQEGEKFIFKPEAEESLQKLHNTIVYLQGLEDQAKDIIGEAGKRLNPNFKGVIGENIKCMYRKYGAKYQYDWKNKSVCEPYLKRKEYFSVDTSLVDKYVKEVGEMPEGITEKDRENKLSITFGGNNEEDKTISITD